MNETLNTVGDVVRWTVPSLALVITGFAWLRFRSTGIRMVVIGFTLMLLSPLSRLVATELILDYVTPNAERIATMLYITGFVGTAGLIVVILGMRRMIKDASRPDVLGTDVEELAR